jgi:hypothetical protein
MDLFKRILIEFVHFTTRHLFFLLEHSIEIISWKYVCDIVVFAREPTVCALMGK